MFEEAFCAPRMRNKLFLICDQLYLMTHVSSGDEKVSFFSVLLALSCGVNNSVQEELLF